MIVDIFDLLCIRQKLSAADFVSDILFDSFGRLGGRTE